MARPKNKIRRKTINTTIDKELLKIVRDISEDTGIPINRLIENALRDKYEKKIKKRIKYPVKMGLLWTEYQDPISYRGGILFF